MQYKKCDEEREKKRRKKLDKRGKKNWTTNTPTPKEKRETQKIKLSWVIYGRRGSANAHHQKHGNRKDSGSKLRNTGQITKG